jgi:hypothetical protein
LFCKQQLVPTFELPKCAFAKAPLAVGTKIDFKEYEPNINGTFRRVGRMRFELGSSVAQQR